MEHLTADQKAEVVREWLHFMKEHLSDTFDAKYTIHEAIGILSDSVDWWFVRHELGRKSPEEL